MVGSTVPWDGSGDGGTVGDSVGPLVGVGLGLGDGVGFGRWRDVPQRIEPWNSGGATRLAYASWAIGGLVSDHFAGRCR